MWYKKLDIEKRQKISCFLNFILRILVNYLLFTIPILKKQLRNFKKILFMKKISNEIAQKILDKECQKQKKVKTF